MKDIKALVLAGFGLNCETETAFSLARAGAAAEIVHISSLVGTRQQAPTHHLDDYQILVFGGGFAWGDDHGAGVLLANRLGHHLNADLRAFLGRGGLVLGICNGFQALVNLGLLPMLDDAWRREVALVANDCGNFQDRWVRMLPNAASPCVFTRGMAPLDLPIRHGEGKLICTPEVLETLQAQNLVALTYGDGQDRPAAGRWPANPNGSLADIAGLTDPSGRVLGLMPHPEGFHRASQHPRWTLHRDQARRAGRSFDPHGPGAGQVIFDNAVVAAREAL